MPDDPCLEQLIDWAELGEALSMMDPMSYRRRLLALPEVAEHPEPVINPLFKPTPSEVRP